jgi:hypothetical protein
MNPDDFYQVTVIYEGSRHFKNIEESKGYLQGCLLLFNITLL